MALLGGCAAKIGDKVPLPLRETGKIGLGGRDPKGFLPLRVQLFKLQCNIVRRHEDHWRGNAQEPREQIDEALPHRQPPIPVSALLTGQTSGFRRIVFPRSCSASSSPISGPASISRAMWR